MAKKTISKEHPITAFRKANEARQTAVKSSIQKKQSGGTPFQGYMKTPGAVASDTVLVGNKYAGSAASPKAKNPKNQKALESAFDKTYGYNYQEGTGKPTNESLEQYKRRMGPLKKKGGSVKSKK